MRVLSTFQPARRSRETAFRVKVRADDLRRRFPLHSQGRTACPPRRGARGAPGRGHAQPTSGRGGGARLRLPPDRPRLECMGGGRHPAAFCMGRACLRGRALLRARHAAADPAQRRAGAGAVGGDRARLRGGNRAALGAACGLAGARGLAARACLAPGAAPEGLSGERRRACVRRLGLALRGHHAAR